MSFYNRILSQLDTYLSPSKDIYSSGYKKAQKKLHRSLISSPNLHTSFSTQNLSTSTRLQRLACSIERLPKKINLLSHSQSQAQLKPVCNCHCSCSCNSICNYNQSTFNHESQERRERQERQERLEMEQREQREQQERQERQAKQIKLARQEQERQERQEQIERLEMEQRQQQEIIERQQERQQQERLQQERLKQEKIQQERQQQERLQQEMEEQERHQQDRVQQERQQQKRQEQERLEMEREKDYQIENLENDLHEERIKNSSYLNEITSLNQIISDLKNQIKEAKTGSPQQSPKKNNNINNSYGIVTPKKSIKKDSEPKSSILENLIKENEDLKIFKENVFIISKFYDDINANVIISLQEIDKLFNKLYTQKIIMPTAKKHQTIEEVKVSFEKVISMLIEMMKSKQDEYNLLIEEKEKDNKILMKEKDCLIMQLRRYEDDDINIQYQQHSPCSHEVSSRRCQHYSNSNSNSNIKVSPELDYINQRLQNSS